MLRLELFGSAATDEFDPARSDIDFTIEYPEGYEFGPWLGRYFDLKWALEALLGYSIDLVMVGAMRNPYFIKSANESRQVLYLADPAVVGATCPESTGETSTS